MCSLNKIWVDLWIVSSQAMWQCPSFSSIQPAWQSCEFFVLFCYVIVVFKKKKKNSSPSFQRCQVRMNWPGKHVYRLCEELCLCVGTLVTLVWLAWMNCDDAANKVSCWVLPQPFSDLPLNAIQLQLSVANFSHSLNSLGPLTNRKVNFHTAEKISALGNNRVNRMLPSDLMLIPWSGTKPSWLLH